MEATFPPSHHPGAWRGARALTDGHVVAAVRETGVPVTELGLVAAGGTLGLTGHGVGHGCGGGGRGSAGSLATPPGPRPLPPPLCRAVWAGPPGRPLRGHHCNPFPSATSGQSHPSVTHCHCLLHIWLSWGWGSCGCGKGCVPHVGGAEPCRRLLHVWAWGAGFPHFRGLWGTSRRRLSSQPGCPGEGSGQVPGTGRVAGPSSDPTFAFHVVVHLKLHLPGPEEVALGTAEVAAVTAAKSVQGTLDTEGAKGKGRGH